MRVLTAGACARAGLPAVPRPSAARPPARKFRRAGRAAANGGAQQAQLEKVPCRKPFCEGKADDARRTSIPFLDRLVVAAIALSLAATTAAASSRRHAALRGT